MKDDFVVGMDGTTVLFKGKTEAMVEFLEANPTEEPRWVYVGDTTDILTESEYLDLAT